MAKSGSALTLVLCLAVMAHSKPVQEQDSADEFDVGNEQKPREVPSFDTILKANRAIQHALFEGDIVIPSIKNAIQDRNRRWNNGTVPYVIDPLYDYQTANMMRETLQELSVRTCVTFVERTDEFDYLYFEINSGCYSYVGRIGGRQTVSIGVGCEYHRTVLHETIHALGFYHEQSRTDRDDFVQIVWENIDDSQEYNFRKYDENSIDSLGVSYDYDSVMHYTDTAFSMNGEKTIIALMEGGENMGRLNYLSKVDIAEINKFYEGTETLFSTGYTDWTAWSACDINCQRHRKRFCDGSSCSTWGEVESESTGCDVECIVGLDPECPKINHTDLAGTLVSPLYPRNYKNSVKCRQTVTAPAGGIVTLHFHMFSLEDYFDNVYVYDGPDESATRLGSYTGNNLPADVTSTSHYLTVVFDADYAIVDKGFSADYVVTFKVDHSCDFENSDHCGWTNDNTGELQFSWISGGTRSAGTGPDADHTYENDDGHYLYLESSHGTGGDAARLTSPMFPRPYSSVCFGLWYNMYGEDIGDLNVYLVINGVKETVPFISHSGDLGDNDWRQTFGVINTSEEFQIKIEAVRGEGYVGDIAIDDVTLQNGPCPVQ